MVEQLIKLITSESSDEHRLAFKTADKWKRTEWIDALNYILDNTVNRGSKWRYEINYSLVCEYGYPRIKSFKHLFYKKIHIAQLTDEDKIKVSSFKYRSFINKLKKINIDGPQIDFYEP